MNSRTPAHYKSLSLGNFRGFKNVDNIPLAPLTFLVGPNSSGKSSICDALLLLAQSNVWPADKTSLMPTWSGDLVDLGSFNDTVFAHRSSLPIRIGVEVSLESGSMHPDSSRAGRFPVKFDFQIRGSDDDPVGYVATVRVKDTFSNEHLTIKLEARTPQKLTLEYLGSSRSTRLDKQRPDMGYPLRAHEIEKTLDKRGPSFRGRRAAWQRLISHLRSDYLNQFADATQRVSSGRAAPKRWFSGAGPDESVPNALRKRFDAVYPTMIESTTGGDESRRSRRSPSDSNKRLIEVLEKLDIASDIIAWHPAPSLSAISLMDNVTNVISNLIDFGYGTSQVIPVITACVSDRIGPIFVEQPEIHLHPRAQGNVAELLCETSLRRQVVVETHSVHMINRARILIAKGVLDHNNVVINFVNRNAKGSHVHTIPIKENADFGESWPEGFFEERYEDTMALLKLKSQGEKS